MNDASFPSRDVLTIGFAHVTYRAAEEFAARRTGLAHFEVRTLEELERRRAVAHVSAGVDGDILSDELRAPVAAAAEATGS